MDEEKKIVVLIVAAILIVGLVLGSIVYYLVFHGGAAEISDVSYEIVDFEEGEKIRFTVETEGGSWLGEEPSYRYSTVLGVGESGGGSRWNEDQDGEYVKYIGPYEEGTKVWIMVYVDAEDHLDWKEIMVALGEDTDSSEDHDLSIEDISDLPRSMELEEEKDISVEIRGADRGTEVHLTSMYAYRYDTFIGSETGSGTGGSTVIPEGDPEHGRYLSTISVGERAHEMDPPSSYSGVLLFRISCYDDNRRVVSQTQAVTLSD